METIVTLEALKSVGEVHSPVRGEVIEVNPRLWREPALVTHSPLDEGWLVRLAFSGSLPRYLQRSRAIARTEIESLLTGELPGLQRFILERLGEEDSEEALQELAFDGLRTVERLWVHQAAEQLDLATQSYGTGAGRKLVVKREARQTDDARESLFEQNFAEAENVADWDERVLEGET